MKWVFSTYALGFEAARKDGKEFSITRSPEVRVRPHRVMSNVAQPGLAALTGLVIAGAEQLVLPMDFYEMSFLLAQELDRAFLKERGLTGKTDREIDAWLDARCMDMPSVHVGRLELPSIPAGSPVTLRGTFGDVAEDFRLGCSVLGAALFVS